MSVGLLFGYMLLGILVFTTAGAAYLGLKWLSARLGFSEHVPDYPPDWGKK